jgi:hypothetical protein
MYNLNNQEAEILISVFFDVYTLINRQ